MGKKKKEDPKPRKILITFEVEENQTNCCECLFGGTCPYTCAFADKLDCAKYNLATLQLKSIEPIEEG
jgi:hypothetical protein